MQDDDVKRVARAMRDYARSNDYDDLARAAMTATLELAAEALRARLRKAKTTQEHYTAAIIAPTADWLQQRANEVKEAGNG